MEDFDSFGFIPSTSTSRRTSVPSSAPTGSGGHNRRASVESARTSIGGFKASSFDEAPQNAGKSGGGSEGDIMRREVERCVPVTISIIEKTFTSGSGNNSMSRTLHGGPMGAVSITGWVTEVVTKGSQLILYVADGTGCVRVVKEGGVRSGGCSGWGSLENISGGDTVRVIGSVRAGKKSSAGKAAVGKATVGKTVAGGDAKDTPEDKENSSAGGGSLVDNCLCVDACHLKIINKDFAEYALFAPLAVVSAAIDLGAVGVDVVKDGKCGKQESEIIVGKKKNHENEQQTVVKQKVEEEQQESWEAEWHGTSVVGYAHISDPIHCDVIRLLQAHPNSKDGGSLPRTVMAEVLKQFHSEEDVDDALAVLAEEGEILETNNSYCLPM
eukprot:GHVS01070153.1.p1 GENE.GHVS01070153.1~~GHVS01070153.1.p1  ORF type:complete len:384 (-),score=70.78 GHVS01070153.1:381-1532(-)